MSKKPNSQSKPLLKESIGDKAAPLEGLKVLARIIARRIMADTDKHINEKVAENQNEFEDIS